MKKVIYKFANGQKIYFDPVNSHAATHMREEEGLRDLVMQEIPKLKIDSDQDFHKFEIKFDRVVGTTDLVKINENDEVFYALRKNRVRYTPFVKGKNRPETKSIVILLKKNTTGHLDLHSAWYGVLSPPTPGSEHETAESREYWAKHALIWGRPEVIEGTVRKTAPWDEN